MTSSKNKTLYLHVSSNVVDAANKVAATLNNYDYPLWVASVGMLQLGMTDTECAKTLSAYTKPVTLPFQVIQTLNGGRNVLCSAHKRKDLAEKALATYIKEEAANNGKDSFALLNLS